MADCAWRSAAQCSTARHDLALRSVAQHSTAPNTVLRRALSFFDLIRNYMHY